MVSKGASQRSSGCRLVVAFAVASLLGCGSDVDPVQITFGETTLVVLVNPPVNDDNEATVPPPGTVRSGVGVAVQGGPTATTDANGVAVLEVAAGDKTITLTSGTLSGTVTVSIDDKDLREVAVALTQNGASIMTEVAYALGGAVVQVTPATSVADVNAALAQSNTIVFFGAGTYTGDVVFSGSNVTLFGRGAQGGQVTLNGNVDVGGSGNRIRGARVTSDLTVSGSDFGLSFSRVVGAFDLVGSDGTLLNNSLCGTVTISGSGVTALGNAGMAPVAEPSGGC